MEKISWTDRTKMKIIQRVRGERNILHIINRRKANRIGHMLRRNYFLKYIIEGKTKETERRRRCKQLLDEVKKREETGN